MSVRSFKDYAD